MAGSAALLRRSEVVLAGTQPADAGTKYQFKRLGNSAHTDVFDTTGRWLTTFTDRRGLARTQ
jgi:hypothetical protein